MKTGKIAVLCLMILGLLCSCVPEQSEPEQSDAGVSTAGAEELDFSAQYIRTDSLMEEDGDDWVAIRTAEELENYCAETTEGREQYNDTQEFLKACKRYDEEYFKENLLIMAVLWEGSGSNRHEVERVSFTQGTGTLQVEIEEVHPGPDIAGTADIAQWHILVEVELPAAGEGAVEIEVVRVDNHKHSFAEQPQVVDDMDDGRFDTATAKVSINGKEYTFTGENGAALLNLLISLDYGEQQVCECPAEVQVESGAGSYEINQGQAFVRCKKGQVALTWGQLLELEEILQEGFLLRKETVMK